MATLPSTPLSWARLVAVMAPSLLLGGALASQYVGGLAPCEMCYWQRWPHLAAILLALAAIVMRGRPGVSRALTVLAAVAIAVSGAVGLFHAGVEYGWWDGITSCAAVPGSGGGDLLADIMAAPVIRCDVPQWTLLNISLAGFNALFSLIAVVAILLFLGRGASGRKAGA